MEVIGVIDTMFAIVNMGEFAREELKTCPGYGKQFEIVSETVPGFKDLAVGAKKLIEERKANIVIALGMPGKEALKWIAIFRLGMPNVILRYAGGREVTLGDLQALGLESGINALIVGNYLTTLGRGADEDLKMLEELSMPVGSLTGVI